MYSRLGDKMKELQLQPRLQLLADLVPQDARLADIGTDHGYLPVWLIQQGRITFAIAADIGVEPLEHARRTAEEYQVQGIDFRLCDGLKDIAPQEVDTVIIAGMGGDTMASILSAAPWTKNGVKLLLQPMTKVEMLRVWLADNGYTFTDERLVWDKNFLYPVFVVEGGTMKKLTAVQEYGGVMLAGDQLYGDYLDKQMERLQKAIDGLNRANDCISHGVACERQAIRRALEEKRRSL